MSKITWRNDTRKLSDLIPWDSNPRFINDAEAQRLNESLDEFGQIQTIAIGPDDEIYDGHQRQLVWAASQRFGPDYVVDVRVASRALTTRERQKLVVMLHRGTMGAFDFDMLANEFDIDDLLDWGFNESEFGIGGDDDDEGLAPPIDLEYRVVIECNDEQHQFELLKRFEEEGLKCQALIS